LGAAAGFDATAADFGAALLPPAARAALTSGEFIALR